MTLPSVFNDPVWYAALVVVIVAIVHYQRTLSWREYRRLHGLKVRLLPLIDRYTTLFVVSRKKGTEDKEFIRATGKTPHEAFTALLDAGGSPHLINSIKAREYRGSIQYTTFHVVFLHDDGTQTECYGFEDAAGGVHLYAHHEEGVQNPEDHLEDTNQVDGDPRGVIPESL